MFYLEKGDKIFRSLIFRRKR